MWYNPEMESVNFVLPGLIAVILMMISALLTSVTIAREKETGTMEQILVSPINPLEIVLGKVVPYVLIAFFDGALVVIAARYIFAVPINGSILLLALMSFFLSLCMPQSGSVHLNKGKFSTHSHDGRTGHYNVTIDLALRFYLPDQEYAICAEINYVYCAGPLFFNYHKRHYYERYWHPVSVCTGALFVSG